MSKKTAYVVGNNTSLSLSPTIFHHWFKKYNIDGEYGFIEIKDETFDKEIQSILKIKNLVGLNITIPYKEKIIPHLISQSKYEKAVSLEAEKIGSVNYLFRNENNGFWVGDNTDGLGFGKAIEPLTKQIKKNTAIIIGYGGAAKAIINNLQSQFKKIKLFNRSFEKIENIYKNKIEVFKLKELAKHTYDADLIINTTPINVLEKSTKWRINNKSFGFDVVYKPKEGTGFLIQFKQKKRIEGIGMLVYQAAPCFKVWFGIDPEIDQGLFDALYSKMNNK